MFLSELNMRLSENDFYVDLVGSPNRHLNQQAFWPLVVTPTSLETCHLIIFFRALHAGIV